MTSYYEITHPLAKLRGSHFIDHFDGDSLRAWWNITSSSGSASASPVDSADGGMRLTTDTTNLAHHSINFNNKRPFTIGSNVTNFISVFRRVSTTNFFVFSGLYEDGVTGAGSASHRALWGSRTDLTFFHVQTYNGGSTPRVDSSVTSDTSFHNFQLLLQSSLVRGYIDGTFETVNTSDIPTEKLEPMALHVTPREAAVKTADIKYIEVFNG